MDPQNQKDFNEFVRRWNLSEIQILQFERYIHLIEEWNQKTRLVSKNDTCKIVSKHLNESLLFYRPEHLNFSKPVLDLGSGAGFPGIPLKIYLPFLKLTLVESRRMKSLFLQEVVDAVKLNNVEVIGDRVEKLVCEKKNTFGLIVARAVAELRTLWQWSEPLLAKGGILATLKGGDLEGEVSTVRDMFPDVVVELLKVNLWSQDDAEKFLVLVKRKGEDFGKIGVQ